MTWDEEEKTSVFSPLFSREKGGEEEKDGNAPKETTKLGGGEISPSFANLESEWGKKVLIRRRRGRKGKKEGERSLLRSRRS